MHSNGQGRKHLLTDAIPTLQPVSSDLDLSLGNCHFGPVAMNGGEVFKFAVRAVPQVIEDAMEKAALTSDQVCTWNAIFADMRVSCWSLRVNLILCCYSAGHFRLIG